MAKKSWEKNERGGGKMGRKNMRRLYVLWECWRESSARATLAGSEKMAELGNLKENGNKKLICEAK